MIEEGRFKGLEEKDRICHKCLLHKIENETHFILRCSLYKEERQVYLNTIYIKFPNIKHLEPQLLLLWLMSCEDRNLCILTAKFIFECFEKRGHSPNLNVNR